MEMTLTNKSLNIELVAMATGHDDPSIDVDVHDTLRDIWGSMALCQNTGQFHDDKPMNTRQQDWIEGDEVEQWLEDVGY